MWASREQHGGCGVRVGVGEAGGLVFEVAEATPGRVCGPCKDLAWRREGPLGFSAMMNLGQERSESRGGTRREAASGEMGLRGEGACWSRGCPPAGGSLQQRQQQHPVVQPLLGAQEDPGAPRMRLTDLRADGGGRRGFGSVLCIRPGPCTPSLSLPCPLCEQCASRTLSLPWVYHPPSPVLSGGIAQSLSKIPPGHC